MFEEELSRAPDDPDLLDLFRLYHARRWQVWVKLRLPNAIPHLLTGARTSSGLCVIGAIVGEWAGGDRGLGVLINLARGSLFDIPLLFATLTTIGLIGVGLYLAMLAVERLLVGAR